ncbi:acyl-CoA dehydrogenase [Oceanobacillus piezotolerans]|uniref:Acyl-CoA dehydrogenase n=1 Tax=Oceanobacillus piezotolerans TaxID=2448030 RepID=A0A498DKK6_9BACI|nr:acyl-CoA dehydrogenase family protein [Oceanobacillus piezotolerans]RLL47022.1 acyl-CoA dehydrogenase [Oceanobacillus piezotolerans]
MTTKELTQETVVEQLLEEAREIGELAEKEAREAEVNGTISPNVAQLMRKSSISKMMLPKEYGGPQVDLRTFGEIVRTVAYYNVSASWLTFLYPLHNTLPSYLEKEARDEIVHQGGLISDIFAAIGTYEEDGDGYRISGKWNFASGVNYSDWIGVGVNMQLPGMDEPEVCLPILKTSDLTIVENWDTFGLRGTGSNQIIAENVYVPKERIVPVSRLVSGLPPEEDYDRDYPFYNIPYFPAFYMGFPYMALGGTKRIIDEFKSATEKRRRLMDNGLLESESPRSQRVMAEITTDFLAAEALMDQYITKLEDSRNNPNSTPNAEFFAMRTKITKTCTEIAVRVLLTLGGAGLYKGGPIELFFRDILSVATHKTSLYEDSVQAFGQELFGFDSGVRG